MFKYASICIFTQLGRTYTFKDVEISTDNETVLVFRYRAMSDGLYKIATFQKSVICGWSLTYYTGGEPTHIQENNKK